eukprot:4311377-Alexandrium_andersonii.AAC.1
MAQNAPTGAEAQGLKPALGGVRRSWALLGGTERCQAELGALRRNLAISGFARKRLIPPRRA